VSRGSARARFKGAALAGTVPETYEFNLAEAGFSFAGLGPVIDRGTGPNFGAGEQVATHSDAHSDALSQAVGAAHASLRTGLVRASAPLSGVPVGMATGGSSTALAYASTYREYGLLASLGGFATTEPVTMQASVRLTGRLSALRTLGNDDIGSPSHYATAQYSMDGVIER